MLRKPNKSFISKFVVINMKRATNTKTQLNTKISLNQPFTVSELNDTKMSSMH